MSESPPLTLIWSGPADTGLLRDLWRILGRLYPSLDRTRTFILTRNLEEMIRTLLSQGENIIQINNRVYFTRPLNELLIRIPLRSGSNPIFPEAFFIQENLSFNPESTQEILSFIRLNVGYIVGAALNVEVADSLAEKDYKLFLNDEIVLIDDLYTRDFGDTLYLLHLQRLFQGNPQVCIMVPDLSILLDTVRRMEVEIGTLTEEEFKRVYPAAYWINFYAHLLREYQEQELPLFRFGLLRRVIQAQSYSPALALSRLTGKRRALLPIEFRVLFESCHSPTVRYTVASINIQLKFGHANILIIDHYERTIERFDPIGAVKGRYPELDQVLNDFAAEIGYRFIPSEEFCPRRGIQSVERLFKSTKGHCVTWSIIYAEERLRSPESRNWVAENLYQIIIDRYGLSRSTPAETALAIEEWLVNRINSIFNDLEDIYESISNVLGVRVTYVNGKLLYRFS